MFSVLTDADRELLDYLETVQHHKGHRTMADRQAAALIRRLVGALEPHAPGEPEAPELPEAFSDLPPLRLQGHDRILDRWFGPAYSASTGQPLAMLGTASHPTRHDDPGAPTLFWTMGLTTRRHGTTTAAAVDLFRQEVRDRLARVLARDVDGRPIWLIATVVDADAAHLAPADVPDPEGEEAWWPAGFWLGDGFWTADEEWAHRNGFRHCAALADLDPRDARKLPDGSRWVDAAALKAIALQDLHQQQVSDE